ncbi:MAG: AmmeMemoRadiSam system protein B [Candidatus Marinimicrobia bacterium]|nr:AmmeMemoRadiSam system protein B [Candidatus Neomarinimicrobiota bacterium]
MNREATWHSPLAGHWYSADPAVLRAQIEDLLTAAAPQAGPSSAPRGLIVPHAGYAWSGGVAAAAYALVRGRPYQRVIVIGPSHRVHLPDQVALPDFTRLTTPLGAIALDTECIERLGAGPEVAGPPEAQRAGHSVQIQGPFLQVVLPAARLTPLVAGQLSPGGAARIADRLQAEIGPDTLLVVSTDFTHYGPAFGYVPFRQDIPTRLRELDLAAFARLQARDPAGFRSYIEQTGATICGRDPLTVLAHLLGAQDELRLLAYAQSGVMTQPNDEQSVSYLAAAWQTK